MSSTVALRLPTHCSCPEFHLDGVEFCADRFLGQYYRGHSAWMIQMLKLTENNIINFRKIYLPHIAQCMDVGNVARLRSVLQQHRSFVQQANQPDFNAAFAKAENWLIEAEAYEASNGIGSRFDPEHPLVVNARRSKAERQIPGLKADRLAISSSTESKTSVQWPSEVSAA